VAFTVVGLSGLGIVMTARTGEPGWIFVPLPFALVLFFAGRYAPLGYRLAPDGVHVERKAGARIIPYRAIRGVDRAPRRLRGTSLAASKGIFGRFGRFWNASLGSYTLYLTNTDNVVWLSTDGGLVALSPDRPDEFVEALERRLG
jgi:hypothetical protein